MAFQLVRVGDDDIAIWQTEYGHIYVFAIDPDGLRPIMTRDAPDAAVPASAFSAEALLFATGEARARRLIGAATAALVRA